MYTPQRFLPHLQYFATLPCKIRKKKKNLPNFHVEHNNYVYVTCHKNIAASDILEQRNGDKHAKVVVNTLYARLSHEQLSFIFKQLHNSTSTDSIGRVR